MRLSGCCGRFCYGPKVNSERPPASRWRYLSQGGLPSPACRDQKISLTNDEISSDRAEVRGRPSRSGHRLPTSAKRDSAVRAALALFQKADCDRLGNRVARGCPACVRVAGEHCEGSDTSAATFRNCLEDRLQDSLFGSTEAAEVNGGRQIHRLLSHGCPSKNYSRTRLSATGASQRCRVRFSSADWCEVSRRADHLWLWHRHEELRNEQNNSAYEPPSSRSTPYGSEHLIRVFPDIGRIFSSPPP